MSAPDGSWRDRARDRTCRSGASTCSATRKGTRARARASATRSGTLRSSSSCRAEPFPQPT